MKIKIKLNINSIVAKMLPIFKNKLSDVFNNFLEKKVISATIDNIDFVNVSGGSLEAVVTVRNADYSAIVKRFLPDALEKVRDDGSVLFRILDLIKDEQDDIIDCVVNALNDRKKERIITLVVDEYNEKICSELSKMTKLDITDISVMPILSL